MGGPAILDAQSDHVLDFLDQLAVSLANKAPGALVTDGGSTQLTGASGLLNIDLDVSAHDAAVVDGAVLGPILAASDVDPDAGDSVDWGAISGKSLIAAVVLLAAGTYVVVPGAVADTGEEVSPTDAEVLAAVGEPSVRIADVNIERTGDTTLSLTVDYSARAWEITGYKDGFATTEDEFKDTGAPRVVSPALA